MNFATLNKHLKYIKKLNRARNYKMKRLKLYARLHWLDKRLNTQTIAPASSKKVLLSLLNLGIGDAIVATGFTTKLAQHGYSVSILCEPRNSFIFKQHTTIKHVYEFHQGQCNTTLLDHIQQLAYDVFIDTYDINNFSPLKFQIIKHIQPRHVIGFNQHQFKLFNTSIKYDIKNVHISDRYKTLLSYFNIISTSSFKYNVQIPMKEQEIAHSFVEQYSKRFIVTLNTEASEQARNLSPTQIQHILSFLDKQHNVTTILIGTKKRLSEIEYNAANIVKAPAGTFLFIAAIVKQADLVISPDTSIVHLACAFNKPLIALYHHHITSNGDINHLVWGPNYVNATQLFTEQSTIVAIPSEQIISAIQTELTKLRSKNKSD